MRLNTNSRIVNLARTVINLAGCKAFKRFPLALIFSFFSSKNIMQKKYTRVSLWLFLSACTSSLSTNAIAQQPTNAYQMLIGGSLKTCSSYSTKQCIESDDPAINTRLRNGKKERSFLLSHEAFKRVETEWPLDARADNDQGQNERIKQQVLSALKKLVTNNPAPISRYDVLDAFDRVAPNLLDSLSDQSYYFVLDQLEILVTDSHTNDKSPKRKKEFVYASLSKEQGSREILAVIEAVAKNSDKKRVLSITASGRDPYESADFYQGLFDTPELRANQVVSEWLPLTPALAKAMTNNNCHRLDEYRQQQGNYGRERVYPDLTKAELELCQMGINGLRTKLQSASVVMLNGGDQSLTRQAFFDAKGKPYPWLEELFQVPMLVGTSAGTAVQSGGKNKHGKVPMITNGTSLQALKTGAHSGLAPSLRCTDLVKTQSQTVLQATTDSKNESTDKCTENLHPDSLTYLSEGGLGSFRFGILDTHFSERNRTTRLLTLLKETGQARGFGIDETTALLVANSGDGSSADVAVLGKSGVAVIEPIHVGATTNNGANSDFDSDSKSDFKSTFIRDSFYYSYWPSGAKANLSLTTDEITINHSAAVKESLRLSLPTQLPARFDDILTNGKLRSLTQVMCMTDKTSSEGIQRDGLTTWQLSFEKTPQTRFTLYSVEKNQCAIERLKISVNKLKLKFG